MKFCKDCKYYRYGRMVDRCTHAESYKSTNLVSGDSTYDGAIKMRATKCDKEAKLFEQKISWFKKWL